MSLDDVAPSLLVSRYVEVATDAPAKEHAQPLGDHLGPHPQCRGPMPVVTEGPLHLQAAVQDVAVYIDQVTASPERTARSPHPFRCKAEGEPGEGMTEG